MDLSATVKLYMAKCSLSQYLVIWQYNVHKHFILMNHTEFKAAKLFNITALSSSALLYASLGRWRYWYGAYPNKHDFWAKMLDRPRAWSTHSCTDSGATVHSSTKAFDSTSYSSYLGNDTNFLSREVLPPDASRLFIFGSWCRRNYSSEKWEKVERSHWISIEAARGDWCLRITPYGAESNKPWVKYRKSCTLRTECISSSTGNLEF